MDCVPPDFFRLLIHKGMRYFGTAAILHLASSSFKIVERSTSKPNLVGMGDCPYQDGSENLPE
jgi:hypothetical protein